jgi:membrane-bound lytic murein transglycosylase B
MKKRFFLALTFCLLTLPAYAVESDFSKFVEELRSEAQRNGISTNIIDQALPKDLAVITKLIERSKPKNQTQSKLSFSEYLSRLVSDTRIANGKNHYATYQEILQRISNEYGIPAEVIVALWGIESAYGSSMGTYDIVPSLATLAYGSHRKGFFRKELFNALQILQEGHITPDKLKGSWAGAMGQCQFMPSSFIDMAADGDGDGKKDIWANKSDVFASAANYLKTKGWKTGEAWGQRVILTKYLPADLEINKQGLTNKFSINKWKELGVMPKHGYNDYKSNSGRLFVPEGPSEKAYLVYNNFKTIMRWNNSTSFAFSVLTLAEKINDTERRGL